MVRVQGRLWIAVSCTSPGPGSARVPTNKLICSINLQI